MMICGFLIIGEREYMRRLDSFDSILKEHGLTDHSIEKAIAAIILFGRQLGFKRKTTW